MTSRPNPLTFQELVLRLQTFWAERGCVLQQPYDLEVGAGTMAPETFLRVLGPKPYKAAYVQPSRRPADGRYGENPNRLYKHMQLQVILKPPPENVQELYLESLGAMGIDLRQHDIKFEEDNWESPTLGAWGIGWQVMLDGLEITQFTYFQQCGGVDLFPISAELTYGLERIAAFLQDVDSIYDIVWARDPETGRATTYGDVRLADELQMSVYNFEMADVEKTWKHFELCETECKALLEQYVSHFSQNRGDAPPQNANTGPFGGSGMGRPSVRVRVEVDARNEKMNAKIREHALQKVPFMLVVGDKEAEAGKVNVRTRGKEKTEDIGVEEFEKKISELIEDRSPTV
jgi:glycyl-tRNA synthetase alpha chain